MEAAFCLPMALVFTMAASALRRFSAKSSSSLARLRPRSWNSTKGSSLKRSPIRKYTALMCLQGLALSGQLHSLRTS